MLVTWALILIVTWLAAPTWNDLVQDREFDFLPADTPSRRAADVFAKAFPDDRSASTIVLVGRIVAFDARDEDS